VRVVAEDLGVDAVKIGMLGDVATIEAVAEALDALPGSPPVVHDPVMVAESGARLLPDDAIAALVELILPRATVVTPNLHEARALAAVHVMATVGGAAVAATADLDGAELAGAVHALGPGAVIVTGGHRDDGADLLFDGTTLVELPGERHPDGAAHGSGCTHSSTVAARLALGDTLPEAARRARAAASAAVRDGLRDIGAGAGPVDVIGLRARQIP
jgi:hydroxymethylpyrimidine/phosphomethylpyrimidine kinase